MTLVRFAGFHLYRQGKTGFLHNEIDFSLFLAVEIIKVETMAMQFLRYKILVNGTKVDVGIIVKDS